MCSGSSQSQPVSVCKKEGHTIVPTADAKDLIITQLQPLIEGSLTMLNQCMSHKLVRKERFDTILRALNAFTLEVEEKVSLSS